MNKRQLGKWAEFKVLYACLITLFSVLGCERGNDLCIEHTEDDIRTIHKYFKYPVARPDLELINILDTEYDVQIMNADEWGAYFDIIRLDFDAGKVEIAIQDSIHPFPRKYEFKQYLYKKAYADSIDSLIQVFDLWNVKDTLNKNRVTDGGDLSIILIGEDRVKLITWQDFPRKNKSPEKERVQRFYTNVWHITKTLMENEYLDHKKTNN